MFMSREKVDLIKKIYPKGTVVVLDHMDDPYSPPMGTKGTVTHVDDIGQIHVDWENGSSLALNTDVDSFHTA